ncbi:fibronectin type-III domain-containing protein 3A isoform X2 [Anthonomus grandis grandis]|uniref:fibronectin type-III domain-containing protein 3A isoform X2 n=1 Tax=Anthonomus grandis grandis TaxID=2921223 RepID=UPI0021651555|nr:fibronectin type-III domain-containing protein 3A isoform X2 [Anthonomus grandis grandis]
MVASQGVETATTPSPSTGLQHHHHHHHHHHGTTGEVPQYCMPMPHSHYGEYYPGEHYIYHQAGEYGPVTVPMVSTNQSPPIAMPVHVPPGHVVQQVVDENGTLRHVILSPSQHPNLLPLPNPPHYNNSGPPNGTNQSQQYYPSGVGNYPPQGYHSMPGAHTVPSPTHLGHSPPPNPMYYKDERTQRQHIKLKKKLQEKHQKVPDVSSPRKDLVNGLKRGPATTTKDKGMNSVGTSEDGEESSVPDEEDSVQVVTDLLSSVQPPKVQELNSRSALLQWAAPLRLSESASNDSGTNEIDIPESDLRYEVLLSDKSRDVQRDMKFKSIYNGPALSCRIQDLKPGQEYSVSLQVHLDELQGYATEPIKFVTPACEPDQPQPPKLGTKTKNSLQLRWSPVNDNGSKILFYILEYDAGKGGDFEEVHKSRIRTQFNLQKLQPATTYKFRLAAVNDIGKSAYSDVVAYRTTDNPPAQPSPPTLVEATVSTLHLKWHHRPKDEEYTLQMNDLKTKYGHMNLYNGRETSYVCQQLSCYSDYTFRLKASNEGGTSPWSEEITFKTKPDRPDRPSKPIVKGRIHAYSFRLKWEPPSNTGGAEITKYILEVNSGSGYEQVYCGPDTEATCDRLTPGTTYQLRVSCASAGGQSNPSDPCTVTTEAIGPGMCGIPKLIGKAKPDALTVRWTEPDYNGGAPVLDYELEMTNPDSSRLIVHKSKETECTVAQGIIPGKEYAFAVRAVNRICAGPWSETLKIVSGAAPPGAPSAPILKCQSPFQVTIEWNEPISNGALVTEYRLEMNPESPEDLSQFVNIYQGPQTSYEAKNLTPFKKYYFRVQAFNAAGAGPFSCVVSVDTPAAAPSAVSILRSEVTPTTIALLWAEPACNGAEILFYNIELGDRVIETDGPVTEYTIEDLQPEVQYKIKIQAVNAVGPGAFSSTWRTATLRLPPAPPSLECIGTGHNYLKLKWGEGKNLDYTQFSLEMENVRSKEWQCVYKGTAFTCKVNKLHELTTYRFRINATNDAGVGDFSSEFEFSTNIAPPAVLKSPKVVEVEQRTCTIEWIPSKNSFNDPIEYQVQVSKLKEQIYKQVHRGSDTKCTIESLEPGVEYSARVAPIRLAPTAGELTGPHSQPVTFTTMTGDVSAVTRLSPSSSTPTHSAKGKNSTALWWQGVSFKKFYKEHLVYIWALLLTVVGVIISFVIASFL